MPREGPLLSYFWLTASTLPSVAAVAGAAVFHHRGGPLLWSVNSTTTSVLATASLLTGKAACFPLIWLRERPDNPNWSGAKCSARKVHRQDQAALDGSGVGNWMMLPRCVVRLAGSSML